MKTFGPPRNGIKSTDYALAVRGALLTNARIDHYARQGYYGEAAKHATTPQPRKRRVKRFDAMAEALNLLS